MNTPTIPIKTVPDLIRHYERKSQQIADNFEERARWGHRQRDAFELSMIKEFLLFLYGLDKDVEIAKMEQASALAWQRVMKYINYAADEARRHISDQEIEDDEWEEGDDYEEC